MKLAFLIEMGYVWAIIAIHAQNKVQYVPNQPPPDQDFQSDILVAFWVLSNSLLAWVFYRMLKFAQ